MCVHNVNKLCDMICKTCMAFAVLHHCTLGALSLVMLQYDKYYQVTVLGNDRCDIVCNPMVIKVTCVI